MTISFVAGILIPDITEAQRFNPVKWRVLSSAVSKEEVILTFTADIEFGWHIYAASQKGEGGPLPTKITMDSSKAITVIDGVEEPSDPITKYEEVFEMNVKWFEKKAVFSQKIKLNVPEAVVSGTIEYMCCSKGMCLPPMEYPFYIEVKGN